MSKTRRIISPFRVQDEKARVPVNFSLSPAKTRACVRPVLPVMIVSVFAAACSPSNVGPGLQSDTAQQVSASHALVVLPPGAPSVVAVTQKPYSNAVQQEIALTTDASNKGQNMIYVTAFGPGDSDLARIDGTVSAQPDLRAIYEEMNARLPGLAMKVSPDFAENRYGPIGYAIGRTGAGTTCLYSWQRQTADKPAGTLQLTYQSIDIRVRICSARASAAELLNFVYGYSIVGLDATGSYPSRPPNISGVYGTQPRSETPANSSADTPVSPPRQTAAPTPPKQPAASMPSPGNPKPAAPANAQTNFPTVPAPNAGSSSSSATPADTPSPSPPSAAADTGTGTAIVPPPPPN